MKRIATLTLFVSLFAAAAFAATEGAWTASVDEKRPDRIHVNITKGRHHNMGTTMKIADFTGTIEMVVFPRTLAECKEHIGVDKIIAIKGRFSRRNDSPSIVVEKVKALA